MVRTRVDGCVRSAVVMGKATAWQGPARLAWLRLAHWAAATGPASRGRLLATAAGPFASWR